MDASTSTDAQAEAQVDAELDAQMDASTGCMDEIIEGVGLAPDSPMVGDYCDMVEVCVGAATTDDVLAAFPTATCGPGDVCPADVDCCCSLQLGGVISDETLLSMCQASQLSEAVAVRCWVYGP